MAGGLLQLAAYGAENKYLMGNPQITFFKIVYKHHTNFSIESVDVSFSGLGSISEVSQSCTSLKIKIPRVGDLLHNVFLKVKLPNILSSVYKKFKWVKNLGEVLIDSATLYIGGTKIETFTGEWIHLYNKLSLDEKKRQLYDKLIGNTIDLFDPENECSDILESLSNYLENSLKQKNFLNVYNNNVLYPENDKKYSIDHFISSNPKIQSTQSPYYDPKYFDQRTGLYPSILGKFLYIPIPFFFTKNIGLSLPLLSLQYHDVEIQIDISPIMNLFTILDKCGENNILRRKPNPLRDNHRLSYYVYQKPASPCIPNNKEPLIERIQSHYNNNNYELELSLELFYIFLDDLERNKFAKMSHEYLIEQVSIRNMEGLKGEIFNFDMNLYNPVKEIIWVLKRNDLEKYNIWFNYSNQLTENCKPLWCQDNIINEYELDEKKIYLNGNTWENYLPNIMKQCKISFNSIERLGFKSHEYFDNLQPYLYHSSGNKGIYLYSFSIEPEKFQPSGCVNMSMISTVTLEIETQIPPLDPEIEKVLKCEEMDEERKNLILNSLGIRENNCVKDKQIFKYTYNLSVYIVNYNVLKIVSGMGGLAYTN